MSSSTASPIRSVLNVVDSSPESPEVRGPLLPNQADLVPRMYLGMRRNPLTLGRRTSPSSRRRGGCPTSSSTMCFHDLELIKEDILCLFGFSRKGVELVGDLDERMGKAAMLKALEEEEAGALGAAASPAKVAKKRKASTPPEKEARRQRKMTGVSTSGAQPKQTTEGGRAPIPSTQTTEELPKLSPIITIAEASSPSKKRGLGEYLCHMAPDRDLDRLGGATDSESVSHFAAQLTSAMAWGDEVVKFLTGAHRAMNNTRQSLYEAMGQHIELVAWLEELEAIKAQEKRAAVAEKEALEAQLATERVARAAEEETIRSELDAALAKKTAVEVELEDTKARAEEEARILRNEAINAWDLSKEEFLQSSEFETLCAKKALGYFKVGFSGCLAQFRANGYSEEEHPASFLDFKKALADMTDAEEA
ncbi:scarecrow-like protein 3 [Dorcoceras hygrometricum]|uniref:Scarecrow-like protein 3 n=1 Tax=Dorcoceras hygrometricum TaxID=472368 RepID=A0A2Z6ZZA0_9LAMI|nr:scarecrow-like protein 3 [Dorcoceras hygrometricum]